MTKIAGSGSISQRHGTADPDPHQIVMDPEHWSLPLNETEEIISVTIVTCRPLSHYTAFYGVQSLYKIFLKTTFYGLDTEQEPEPLLVKSLNPEP
jgi:hypothetical protein